MGFVEIECLSFNVVCARVCVLITECPSHLSSISLSTSYGPEFGDTKYRMPVVEIEFFSFSVVRARVWKY